MRFKPSILILVPMLVEGIYKRVCRDVKKAGNNNLTDRNCLLRQKALELLGGRLHIIICGGSFLPSDLVDKFQILGIKLLNGYGITECSPVVSCNQPKLIKKDSAGCIAPQPYCDVKIKNNEILVRGSIVMKGYYKDEFNTSQVFDGEWFKTGDIGFKDEENYLYISGLKKNLIILKDGNNISPVEIETSLEKFPLITRVLIYAMNRDNSEILVAAIHPDYQYAEQNGIKDLHKVLEELIDEINLAWPRYKRIRKIEIYKDIFDKTELRDLKRLSF